MKNFANDIGLGARGVKPTVHPNDVGLRQIAGAAAPQPMQASDVGMKPMAARPSGMSRTELHSQRGMKGRLPRG